MSGLAVAAVRRRRRWLGVLVTAIGLSCGTWLLVTSNAARGAGIGKKEAVYSVDWPEVTLAPKETKDVSVVVTCAKDWKWKTDYKHTLVKIRADGDLKVEPETLDNDSIEKKDSGVIWPFKITGTTPGTGKVLLAAKFAICGKGRCKRFNEEFELAVKVE